MLIQNIAIFCEIKLFHLSKKKFYVSFNIYISPYLSIYLQIYSRLLVNSVVKKKLVIVAKHVFPENKKNILGDAS